MNRLETPAQKLANSLIGFAFLICVGSGHSIWAQDEQPVAGVQVLSIGGNGLSEEARGKLAEGVTSLFSSGGGISFAGAMGGVDPDNGSQLFNLLKNESVRQELGLSDNQYKGAQTIMQAASKRQQEFFRKMISERAASGSGSIKINSDSMRELQAETQAEAEAAIEEILLPKQIAHIRQLAYQIEVAQTGLGEALVNGRLGQEIDVHNDQRQHLLDRAAAIETEARIAIAKIRAAARAKLLAELTPDQRKAAEERLGEYFDYQELTLAQQMRREVKRAREKSSESDQSKD